MDQLYKNMSNSPLYMIKIRASFSYIPQQIYERMISYGVVSIDKYLSRKSIEMTIGSDYKELHLLKKSSIISKYDNVKDLGYVLDLYDMSGKLVENDLLDESFNNTLDVMILSLYQQDLVPNVYNL
jgi:hypothetical protein